MIEALRNAPTIRRRFPVELISTQLPKLMFRAITYGSDLLSEVFDFGCFTHYLIAQCHPILARIRRPHQGLTDGIYHYGLSATHRGTQRPRRFGALVAHVQ